MTDEQSDAQWFARGTASCSEPRMRVYCFAHGGGGASTFRDWQQAAGDDVEIVAVQLPGRESRFDEPLLHSIPAIAAGVVGPITRHAGAVPFAFVGHSMGALVAFELCHLMRHAAVRPSTLTVSGSRAPHLDPPEKLVHALPHAELVAYCTKLGGIPEELLASEQWEELMLPVLRADFEACETYRVKDREPLTLPTTVLAGEDDPVAAPPEVKAWAELFSGPTTVKVWEGDHFFLFSHAAEAITDTVQAAKTVSE